MRLVGFSQIFEFLRVRVTKGKIAVNVKSILVSDSGGLSYQDSTVAILD